MENISFQTRKTVLPLCYASILKHSHGHKMIRIWVDENRVTSITKRKTFIKQKNNACKIKYLFQKAEIHTKSIVVVTAVFRYDLQHLYICTLKNISS